MNKLLGNSTNSTNTDTEGGVGAGAGAGGNAASRSSSRNRSVRREGGQEELGDNGIRDEVLDPERQGSRDRRDIGGVDEAGGIDRHRHEHENGRGNAERDLGRDVEFDSDRSRETLQDDFPNPGLGFPNKRLGIGLAPPSVALQRAGSLGSRVHLANPSFGFRIGVGVQRGAPQFGMNPMTRMEENGEKGASFSGSNSTTATTAQKNFGGSDIGERSFPLDTGLLAKRTGIAQGSYTSEDLHDHDFFQSTPNSSATAISPRWNYHHHDHDHDHDHNYEQPREPTPRLPNPAAANLVSRQRPILGRSHTISAGDGEERRSVIGRRMMERLGARVAQSIPQDQQDGEEGIGGGGASIGTGLAGLKQLALRRQEEKMGLGDDFGQDLNASSSASALTSPLPSGLANLQALAQKRRQAQADAQTQAEAQFDHERELSLRSAPNQMPLAQPLHPDHPRPASEEAEFLAASPPRPSHDRPFPTSSSFGSGLEDSTLDPDHPLTRADSRATANSGLSEGEAWEYEAHLRRSISARRAKMLQDANFNTMASTPASDSMKPMPSPDISSMERATRSLEDQIRKIQTTPTKSSGGGVARKAGGSIEKMLPVTPNRYDDADEDHPRITERLSDVEEDNDDLLPPLAPFANSHHYNPRNDPQGHSVSFSESSSASTASQGTQGSGIPLLMSMSPEIPGLRLKKATMPAMRGDSMSSFPAGVSEHTNSLLGTPGKESLIHLSHLRESQTSEDDSRVQPSAPGGHEYFTKAQQGDMGEDTHRQRSTSPAPAPVPNAPGGRVSSGMSWLDVSDDLPVDPQFEKKKSTSGTNLVNKMKESMKRTRSGSRNEHSPGASSSIPVSGRSTPITDMDASLLSNVPSISLAPGQSSPMPSADPSDPRMRSTKLWPAPSAHAQALPMMHQASDSIIPSLQAAIANDPPASATYIDLAAARSPTNPDSVGKRTWLAEAFFAPTGNHFLHKRKQSADVIAFDRTKRDEASPIPVAPKSREVLTRLDEVLALEGENRPDVLDDPPRRLIVTLPVLQVVNHNTVKSRHILLFSDIMVIAKPLASDTNSAPLDGFFSVKSIVHLRDLSLTSPSEEATSEGSSRHPVVLHFIDLFKSDPEQAIDYLMSRSHLQHDDDILAGLLFKSPELDKTQIGLYLSKHHSLLKVFIAKFHFVGVRLDEALRIFLLAIRLPTERIACEDMLRALAHGWREANRPSFDADITGDLVFAIMQLNDSVHPEVSFGFAFPNPTITADDFAAAFRSKDSAYLVPKEMLEAIYQSIRKERLVQSLTEGELREVILTPSRLPTRLTVDTWSKKIYISIPKPDAGLRIKLQGEGLVCEPSLLDFSNSAEESFRVMGTGLGPRSLLFSRMGTNAAYYANLANTKTFLIEPSFMNNTFNVGFNNHLGLRRKYCFSFEDDATMRDCFEAIMERKTRIKSPLDGTQKAAETVSLQVLQSTLIASEEELALFAKRTSSSTSPRADHDHNEGKDDSRPKAQTGKDIVLTCRQNSLLPIVLGLIHRVGGGQ